MSASSFGLPKGGAARDRKGGFEFGSTSGGGRQAWIGIDVSKEPVRPAPRGLYPLFALAVLVALGVAAVRIDLLRTRYAVAAAMERENELIEEQRQLIVRRRQLRDPVELAVKARERGFRPPAHVVSIPDPAPADPGSTPRPHPIASTSSVAAVSAGPDHAASPSGSEWR